MRISDRVVNDLRVKKTEELLRKTFISMVKEKGYKNVTVLDVVTKAQINRNTFYLHYQDKEDLMDKISNDILQMNCEVITKHFENFDFQSKDRLSSSLQTILNLIEERIDYFEILIKDPSLLKYFYNYKIMIRDTVWDKMKIKTTNHFVTIDYIISGLIGLIEECLIGKYYTLNDIKEVFVEQCLNTINNEVLKLNKSL